jgi:hypothetical protein
MLQRELVDQLRDAYLAGYYSENALGQKAIWALTPEEKVKSQEIEATAYSWARARLSVLMVRATL